MTTSDATVVVAIVVTLGVALHLAAIIDVALMPGWAWRGAADGSKRKWIVQLALIPGWAIVYYRSADRREVRAHLFRCGGVEPDWHAGYEEATPVVTRRDSAVATIRQRRLIRDVVAEPGTALATVPAPGAAPAPAVTTAALPKGSLPAIHWRAEPTGPRALPPSTVRAAAPTSPSLPQAPSARSQASDLPPISWRADDWMPRALPPAKPVLRLTA